jgi:carbon storage regulator
MPARTLQHLWRPTENLSDNLAANDSGRCFSSLWIKQIIVAGGSDPSRQRPFSRRKAVMLVLSRKIGEKLVIGDNITVVVSRVAGNRVTLGIEAPTDVRIVRGELKNETGDSAPAVRSFGVFKSDGDALALSVPRLAK